MFPEIIAEWSLLVLIFFQLAELTLAYFIIVFIIWVYKLIKRQTFFTGVNTTLGSPDVLVYRNDSGDTAYTVEMRTFRSIIQSCIGAFGFSITTCLVVFYFYPAISPIPSVALPDPGAISIESAIVLVDAIVPINLVALRDGIGISIILIIILLIPILAFWFLLLSSIRAFWERARLISIKTSDKSAYSYATSEFTTTIKVVLFSSRYLLLNEKKITFSLFWGLGKSILAILVFSYVSAIVYGVI